MFIKQVTAAAAFSLALTGTGAVQAEEYVIDPAHTMVSFQLSHLGFSKTIGWFGDVSGTIDFNADDLAASSVMATLSVASVNTNHGERDGWIASDKVLNAAANPSITFTSTAIKKSSDTTGKITGALTMNGQTLPVTLDATFNSAGENPLSKKQAIGVSATGKLTRSDWGVSVFVGPLGDEVSIQIELEAVKAEG